MLEIEKFTFGLFETNTYVVSDGQGNALLIDPACYHPYEQEQLVSYLKPFTVRGILATHGHLDHLWAARWANKKWALPVMMHEADVSLAEHMQQQYDMFGLQRKAEPFEIEPFTAKKFELINHKFEIIHTPGHTPGSVCFYWPEEKVLLSGDTLFRMGYGRTDLPGGNYRQLISSLRTLFALPAEVKVYPGHGEPTTIGQETPRY